MRAFRGVGLGLVALLVGYAGCGTSEGTSADASACPDLEGNFAITDGSCFEPFECEIAGSACTATCSDGTELKLAADDSGFEFVTADGAECTAEVDEGTLLGFCKQGGESCTFQGTISQASHTGTGGFGGDPGKTGSGGAVASGGVGATGGVGAGGTGGSSATGGTGATSGAGGAASGGAGGAGGECLRVAIIGSQGSFGSVPGEEGSSALESWLNQNSTATVRSFHEKPTFDAAFLEDFDVLILEQPRAGQADPLWVYGADEVAAVEAWVRTGAHGVIALSGYGGDSSEVDPTNQLLAFAGMQYVASSDTLATPSGSLAACAYCLGNSVPQTSWNGAHPIAAGVEAVGAFHGRAIDVTGSNVQTVSTDGVTVLAAAAQVDQGRVFMFHDDWVTYVSQWDGAGLATDCRAIEDQNHQCWNVHPTTTYQLATFWFNALRWVGGAPAFFALVDPVVQ